MNNLLVNSTINYSGNVTTRTYGETRKRHNNATNNMFNLILTLLASVTVDSDKLPTYFDIVDKENTSSVLVSPVIIDKHLVDGLNPSLKFKALITNTAFLSSVKTSTVHNLRLIDGSAQKRCLAEVELSSTEMQMLKPPDSSTAQTVIEWELNFTDSNQDGERG